MLLQSGRSIKHGNQNPPAKNTFTDSFPIQRKSMVSDAVFSAMSCHVLTGSPCYTSTLPAKWLRVVLNPQQPGGEILGLGRFWAVLGGVGSLGPFMPLDIFFVHAFLSKSEMVLLEHMGKRRSSDI
jgi:hypothetical protein